MKRILILMCVFLGAACCTKEDKHKTDDGPKELAVPSDVKLHDATETTLTFQWKDVKNATGYNWTLDEKETGQSAGVGSTAKRNTSVTGLKKGTVYVFKVRAEAGGSHSEYCDGVEAKTLGEPTPDDVAKVCTDAPLVLKLDSAPELGTSGYIKVFTASGKEVDSVNMADIATVNVLESGIMVPKEQITAATEKNTFMDVLSSGGRTRTVHYTPVKVKGKTLEIRLHSGVLDFDSEYYVTVDESVCGKAVEAGEWKVFTKAAPESANNLTVDAAGGSDFCTVQGALSFADPNGAEIVVMDGTYEEMLYLRDKKDIYLHGLSWKPATIVYPNSEVYMNGSSARCLWLVENCDNLVIENLTIENSFWASDHKGQAETIYFNSGNGSHRLTIGNCSLISWQDTFLCKGQVWVHNSLIAGHCDYIWGYPKACFIENCEIRSRAAGYIVQARVQSASDKGFVFKNCRLTAEEGVKDGSVYLARSAGQSDCFDNVVFINCTMGSVIRPEGWLGSPAPNPSAPTATSGWRENNSKDASGNPITTHNAFGKVLTSAEAAPYSTREDVLGW